MNSKNYNSDDEKRYLEIVESYESVRREESREARDRFWGQSTRRRVGFQPNPPSDG